MILRRTESVQKHEDIISTCKYGVTYQQISLIQHEVTIIKINVYVHVEM